MSLKRKMNNDLLDFNYTVHNDPSINKVIGSQVEEISARILTEVKDIVSLFLLGGYGRGEGSVIVKPEGVVPLGDYDFLIVSNFPHRAPHVSMLKALERKFHLQYHIGVENVWKLYLPIVKKRIVWYEAKFGGKALFGDEKILNLIPISEGKDIDLDEGFSLMFNRLTGMLYHFDPYFFEYGINEKQRQHLIFQSVKGILACGESLLLLNGKYHFSYQKRCDRFLESFETDFREMARSDPDFKEDYKKATRFKLEPTFDMYEDPIEFWFKTKRCLLRTLMFVMDRTMSESSNLASKLHICGKLEEFPSLFLHRSKPQLLDFLIFNWNTLRRLKSFKGLLPKRSSFSDIVRAALFYLGLSIHENGEIDKVLLDRTLLAVSKVVPVSKSVMIETNLENKWRKTRNIVIYAWGLCRP